MRLALFPGGFEEDTVDLEFVVGRLDEVGGMASGIGDGQSVRRLGPQRLWFFRRFSCQPWPGSSQRSGKPSGP